MLIQDATFVIVDTETTGVAAQRDRIIEIAAVRYVGGAVVDRFAQLINPGRSIPKRITSITGISTGMVFDQPLAEDVLPTFLDFLGDDVLVAHNLTFDLGFLNAELARMGRPQISNQTLCTLRLARRLLKGLPSKGLTSIARFYRLSFDKRHRALGDAEVTAAILGHFLKQLRWELDLESLDDVLAYQHRTYSRSPSDSKHLTRIREEVLPELPSTPGVYFMKNGRGKVIYVGKAKNLANRVRSYFNAIEAHPPRTQKLVRATRNVTWEETGSELGALLLESRLIKEKQPKFNRAQRRYRNRPFIRLDTTEAFPRISWSPYLQNDGAEYFGPVGGRGQAEFIVELVQEHFKLRECDDTTFARGHRCLYAAMERCEAPCEGGNGATRYGEAVQEVRNFLMGQDRVLVDLLERRMQEAAARLDFEAAQSYRDAYQRLDRILNKQSCVARPVLEHNAVWMIPLHGDKQVQLLFIRYGRHVGVFTMKRKPTKTERKQLAKHLTTHFAEDAPVPDRYFKREIDELRIVTHWLYVHRDRLRHTLWSPEQAFDAFQDAVLEMITAQPTNAVALS